MNLSNQTPLWIMLCSSLLFSGCATNQIYRSEYTPCAVSEENDCEENSLQTYNTGTSTEYSLDFVEIDDQGQMRDRRQMQALLDSLYEKASHESLLLIVFVHGWHHNAAPGDKNIESFKNNLAWLSAIEHQKKDRKPRKVAGVYVGWQGESIDVPPFNYLTFWDRKNTAQDVGYLGVSELLVKLEEITNVNNELSPDVKSRLVIIGHSFGGAVVFSATSQILASRFVDSQKGKTFAGDAGGFGDLVVLLNPAFEALRYAPFYDMAQARCSYFSEQKPRLAVLTSEADNATGMLFPLGRIFSTLFETHNDVQRNDCGYSTELDEGKADRRTIGHYLPMISHTLDPLAENENLKVARHDNVSNLWRTQESGDSTIYGSVVLTHLNKTAPKNPYLNIRVNKEIIGDHNDVFNEKVMAFIRLLITLSTND
ncbi:MAG: esterase [Gammaproteobacteria bacterium]